MREKIYALFTNPSDMTWEQVLMNLCMAFLIGLLIYISYAISHRGTIYSKKFNVSLVALTVLTGMVMTVIGNNIALSLGMVGALSIVRFRTAIKDSRDTVYIFWTIIAGICCGVGDYLVAGIGSAVTFLVFLVLGSIKSDNRMLLIVRGNRNRQSGIQGKVFQLFHYKAVLRVRNTSASHVEFIYEITRKMLEQAENTGVDVCEEIYSLGEIEYVNIVMQNDEISN